MHDIIQIMKHIHTIVWRENNWFVAKALEVEIASQGKSETEAVKNLQEALELYFEDNSDPHTVPVAQPRLQDLAIPVHA